MTETPAISVVMPVKDGAPFLEEAVCSVLSQRFTAFELLVVDDGSTDGTAGILNRLATEDSRIRILTNPVNIGTSNAINRALDVARGRYAARLDADDVAEADWLEVLHSWLENRPDLDFVGASAHHIRPDGSRIWTRQLSHGPAEMRWALRFDMALVHPTVMFRIDSGPAADLRYESEFDASEDYNFFARRSVRGAEGANLPRPMVNYRIHATSISISRRKIQRAAAKTVALRMQEADFPPDVFEALQAFRDAYYDDSPSPPQDILTGLVAARTYDLERLDPGWSAKEVIRFFETAMVRSGRHRWHARALAALLTPRLFFHAALQRMKDRRR